MNEIDPRVVRNAKNRLQRVLHMTEPESHRALQVESMVRGIPKDKIALQVLNVQEDKLSGLVQNYNSYKGRKHDDNIR